MFKLLSKLLPKKTEVPTLTDPDFGHISFVESDSDPIVGIWQMHDDWELPEHSARLGCSSIPGTINGPSEAARHFLMSKKMNLSAVWDTVGECLEQQRQEWKPETNHLHLKRAFLLTSLALEEPITDPETWEASFEPSEGDWIFISIQLRGDEVIGHTVDS